MEILKPTIYQKNIFSIDYDKLLKSNIKNLLFDIDNTIATTKEKSPNQKVIKLFDTQAEAIKYAQNLADNQDGCITIHKVDGKIRKQDYTKK